MSEDRIIHIYRTETVGRDHDNRYTTYGGGEWTTDRAAIEAKVRADLEARAEKENAQRKADHDGWLRAKAEHEMLVANGFRSGPFTHWEPETDLLTADDVDDYEGVLTIDSDEVRIPPGSLANVSPMVEIWIREAMREQP